MQPPDAATSLAVRLSDDGHRDLLVMGPRTHAIYSQAEPGPSCLQFRLQPGVARPAERLRALVDDVVQLRQTELVQKLIHTDAEALLDAAALQRLTKALTAILPTTDRPAQLARRAAALLTEDPVHVVARRVGVSERQLRDTFTRTVGLAPKHYARIERVRTVLAYAHYGDLAGLAARAGYYDQAHMTTEFRRLMGVPPAAFAAGKRPAPTLCHRQAPD